MKKLLTILSLAVLMFNTAIGQADDNIDDHVVTVVVPEVALIDLEPSASKDFTLTYTSPTEAGNGIENPLPNSSLWLNYTSVKSPMDPSRTVKVSIGTAVSGGISFTVMAMPAPPMSSTGTPGMIGPPVSLSTTPQNLITSIASVHTGTGANFGHNLLYTTAFSIGSYSDLVASSQAVTITYTLTDFL